MPATVFREVCQTSSAICEKVMKLLAARVRDLNARLTEHSIFDLKHRLYAELLRLSQPRAGAQRERIVSPPPYHHVLAARIGCRREQVTREFSALAQDGLIEKRRGALVLLKPDVLERRLSEAMKNEG
jgi:CRP-like cAMP-binding protein